MLCPIIVCIFLSNHSHDIVSNLASDYASNHVNVNPPQIKYPLAAFTPATVGEVRKIILFFPPILFKAGLDSLINPIATFIKASLCSGMFPDDFKQVHVIALLKRISLPKDDLNSYITISNLSFIS